MRRLPAFARLALAWFAPSHLRPAMEGDLLEGMEKRRQRGTWSAWRWLLRQLFTMDLLHLRRLSVADVEPPLTTEVGMLQDLRFALRALARRPVYAAAVMTTLAVGIGANTAMFTLINNVLLRPLPYPDSERLVMLFRTIPRLGFDRSSVSYPDFEDWRKAPEIAEAAAYAVADRTLTGAGDAEQLRGYGVSAGFFPLLRARPLLGRTISAADDVPGAPPVVMLGHGTWATRFGSRTDIIGQTIRLGNEQPVVIGVMGSRFGYPASEAPFWMALRGGVELERDQNFLNVIARLAPGVELDQAQRSLTALAARIDGETGTNPGMGVRVEQRRAFAVRNVEGALLTFQWVVILVLALACAGVTNLMLTSAVGRRREMAIRAAMGASRRRLVRQVLLESLIPSLAGGALGVGLAAVLLRVVHILGANQLPRLDEVALDWRILLATTVAAIGCGLLCGLVPARQATRASLAETLQEGSSAVVRGRGARRTQEGLVIAQVSLAVVLLIGAGLLATTFMRLTAVSPGFDPSGVAAGHVSIRSLAGGDEQGAAAGWLERRDAFFTELRDRVRAIPDVEEAGLTWSLPFSGQGFSTRFAPAESPDLGDETPAIDGSVVDEDFFSTMRIPLFAGRTFTAADRADAPEVVILSEALARRLWPDGNAVGRRVRRGNEGHVLTVVGVVGDTRQRSLAQPVVPMFYQPLAQAPWPAELFVVARGSVPPATLVPRLRAALHQMDPSLPLTNVSVGDGLIAATVAGPRFRATVLAILGGFALLLAVVGLYGVVSLGVAERTREIGLRRALGAGDGAVVGLVVRGGLRLALAGVVLGVAAALLLTRFLASLVHGVSPTDAVTFMGAAAILLLAAAIGSAIPASRAARVDPVECLRGT